MLKSKMISDYMVYYSGDKEVIGWSWEEDGKTETTILTKVISTTEFDKKFTKTIKFSKDLT